MFNFPRDFTASSEYKKIYMMHLNLIVFAMLIGDGVVPRLK